MDAVSHAHEGRGRSDLREARLGLPHRAVDDTGRTVEFLLGTRRDKETAERSSERALSRENTRDPLEIVTAVAS